MTEEPLLEPYEFEDVKIVLGSKYYSQRSLFAELHLGSYLDQRVELALRQFAQGSKGADLNALVERILDRFVVTGLWLGDDWKLNESRTLSDGSKELELTVEFDGDRILWECSPNPVDDVLPEGCDFITWTAPPGNTMMRPLGDVFRNQLIVILPEDLQSTVQENIRAFIAWQMVIISASNKRLERELYMLAEAYEAMNPEAFKKWGFFR